MYTHESQHDVPTAMQPQYELTAEPAVSEPQTIAKAVVAFSGALGVAIASAVADGRVTVWEVVIGVLAAVGTAGGVWATSNKS